MSAGIRSAASGPSVRRRRAAAQQWVSTAVMAQALGVNPKTLIKYAKARRIPPQYLHWMGKRPRWRFDFANRPVFLSVPMSGVDPLSEQPC